MLRERCLERSGAVRHSANHGFNGPGFRSRRLAGAAHPDRAGGRAGCRQSDLHRDSFEQAARTPTAACPAHRAGARADHADRTADADRLAGHAADPDLRPRHRRPTGRRDQQGQFRNRFFRARSHSSDRRALSAVEGDQGNPSLDGAGRRFRRFARQDSRCRRCGQGHFRHGHRPNRCHRHRLLGRFDPHRGGHDERNSDQTTDRHWTGPQSTRYHVSWRKPQCRHRTRRASVARVRLLRTGGRRQCPRDRPARCRALSSGAIL